MALSKARLTEVFTDSETIQALEEIKRLLEIITEDEDVNNSIKLKMLACVNYLYNGGASKESIISPLGMACVAVGTNDLMERKGGGVSFSPAFNTIANQVARG